MNCLKEYCPYAMQDEVKKFRFHCNQGGYPFMFNCGFPNDTWECIISEEITYLKGLLKNTKIKSLDKNKINNKLLELKEKYKDIEAIHENNIKKAVDTEILTVSVKDSMKGNS